MHGRFENCIQDLIWERDGVQIVWRPRGWRGIKLKQAILNKTVRR